MLARSITGVHPQNARQSLARKVPQMTIKYSRRMQSGELRPLLVVSDVESVASVQKRADRAARWLIGLGAAYFAVHIIAAKIAGRF